jgi:hypothetical protein
MSSTTKNLAAALLRAQSALHGGIARDGAGQGYRYTSADHTIMICRAALLEQGLIARAAGRMVAEDRSKTISTFEVQHPESGERLVDVFEFGIDWSGQQEEDKAIAASYTTAWAYWLRDLMALERRDGNEMDSRRPAPTAGAPGINGGNVAPGRPSTPSNPVFDVARPEHLRVAHEAFEKLKVRSDGRRQFLIEKFLAGRVPLDKVEDVLRAEVESFAARNVNPFGRSRA